MPDIAEKEAGWTRPFESCKGMPDFSICLLPFRSVRVLPDDHTSMRVPYYNTLLTPVHTYVEGLG